MWSHSAYGQTLWMAEEVFDALAMKWAALGNKSSLLSFSQPKHLSKVISLFISALNPFLVKCFSKASNESKKKQKKAAPAFVFLAQNRIPLQDLLRRIQVALLSATETTVASKCSFHLVKQLLCLQEKKAQLHAPQISVTKCDTSCLRLKSAVTSPPCLRPGKLAAMLDRFHISLSKASAAVLFGKVSLVPKSGRKSAEKGFYCLNNPHQACYCSVLCYHFICIAAAAADTFKSFSNHRQRLVLVKGPFPFQYAVYGTEIQAFSLSDRRIKLSLSAKQKCWTIVNVVFLWKIENHGPKLNIRG